MKPLGRMIDAIDDELYRRSWRSVAVSRQGRRRLIEAGLECIPEDADRLTAFAANRDSAAAEIEYAIRERQKVVGCGFFASILIGLIVKIIVEWLYARLRRDD